MSRQPPITRKAFERSEWIFDWKRSTGSRFGSWLAVVLVAGGFVLVTLGLRVRLAETVEWAAPRASMIRLGSGEAGRLLAMRARAEGPFPSRFQPSAWPASAALEQRVDEATRVVAEPHVARLRPFPQSAEAPPLLAKRGEPMMPSRPLGPLAQPATPKLRMVPEISSIAGIDEKELPKSLPPWGEPVAERIAARSWRCMVQIDGSGHVLDCVALAGGEDLVPAALEGWLRGVVFEPVERDGGARRWISVAVAFQNQIVKDGTDAE